MTDRRKNRRTPSNLDIRCNCSYRGTPMICVERWTAFLLRKAGADYECPMCRNTRRITLIKRMFGADRLYIE